MPTASVARQEKQAPVESTSSIKQGIVIVEHKIRNLEKRKARLEYYKDLQNNGKELAKDQIAAIAKFDEVVQTLEFARELNKQLNNVAVESAKNAKKQQRKEAQEKAQHELAMIKEALVIQDVLSSLGQENVREDFLQGKSGITLTAEELQQFDDLYVEITPKHDEGTVFIEQFQSPAEHMMHLIEGKPKQAFGTTYAALKEKISAITKSGYFDQNVAPEPEIEQPEAPAPPEPVEVEVEPEPEVAAPVKEEEEEEPQVVVTETGQVLSCTFQSSVVQEDVRAPIDPSFYTSSHLSVFKSGPIDFMQDNELDTPDVDSAIPTLTYTNQSYTPVEPTPPQPETAEVPAFQNQQETDEKEWNAPVGGNVTGGNGTTSGGGGGGDAPTPSAWEDPQQPQTDESWVSMSEQQWQQTQPQQNNDGFIPAGGRGGGRGGRGRGGGGDRGNKGGSGGNRGGRGGGPNQNSRGGYNRDGNYRDNGYYQNGYRERGERGGRGGGGSRGGSSSERPSGGRGGRGGRGGYRGGGGGGGAGGYRQ